MNGFSWWSFSMEQPSATASGESLCSRVSSAWTKLSKVGLCLLGSMLGRLDSIPLTHFGVHDLLLSPTSSRIG